MPRDEHERVFTSYIGKLEQPTSENQEKGDERDDEDNSRNSVGDVTGETPPVTRVKSTVTK